MRYFRTLTSYPFDTIIQFRTYRRLICCCRHHMSRETWVGMSMAFSLSVKIFLSYVPGIHVVVLTRSSSVARTLASTLPSAVSYCKTLKGPSQAPTREPYVDPWVRKMPSFLCASLFQSVCVRVGDDVLLVATWNRNLFVMFTRYRMPLLGAFSCRPSVSPETSAARMPLLIMWLSPTG